jgi:hypothetical protein
MPLVPGLMRAPTEHEGDRNNQRERISGPGPAANRYRKSKKEKQAGKESFFSLSDLRRSFAKKDNNFPPQNVRIKLRVAVSSKNPS